jgi:3-dehydroquinate dehydratase-2
MRNRAKQPAKTLRLLVANGVNLDLLGQREPEIYDAATLEDYNSDLAEFAQSLATLKRYPAFSLQFFQTNHEGELLAKLSAGWDGCLINPGAWTHTSLALADRLKGLGLVFVEVHISNTHAREGFRQRSFTAPHSCGIFVGGGKTAYRVGLVALLEALLRS